MSLIIPEVFAQCVNEKLHTGFKMAQLAYDATADVADITTCGNKVAFPTFDRVAKVGVVTKGTALVPAEVSMTNNEADVKQCGGSVRVYDKDARQIKGAVQDNMAAQLADSMVQDLDAALAKTIVTEATHKVALASATAITFDELLEVLATFGDNVDYQSFAGIAIHSNLYPSFIKMDAFVSREKTMVKEGNGLVSDSIIGYFMGIPVIMSNTACYDGTAKEANLYAIKKGALGYVMQQTPSIEVQRPSLLLATDIIASDMYATKVLDKEGIVIAKKTIV